MSKTSVEIEVETSRAESKALLEALKPESYYGRASFSAKLTRKGISLKVTGKSLGDARLFANSVLRLLKAARESIQAVDRSEQ